MVGTHVDLGFDDAYSVSNHSRPQVKRAVVTSRVELGHASSFDRLRQRASTVSWLARTAKSL